MPDNLGQNLVRTRRVVHKKPIVAELIVDGERVPAIREINPCLGDVVGEKAGDDCTAKRLQMVAQIIPEPRLRQLRELARAIVHRVVGELDCHGTLDDG